MRYAIRFYKGCRALKSADEIIIKYNKKTSGLLKFLKKNKNKRIIADITDLEDPLNSLDIFSTAASAYKNFAIKLSVEQKDIIPDLFDENIKYFFNKSIETWDELISYINMRVSDVYITNELGFDLVNINRICKEKNINIRIYPNVAQSSASSNENLDTFKFFFVRPDDIDLYSNFVDICEFFGPIEKQDILYRIYKDKKWHDNLNFLILGLKDSIHGSMVAPGWAERRITCCKKCNYGHCKICDNIKSLSEIMRENKYKFEESEVDNEHTIIQEYMQSKPNSTTWYNDGLFKSEISEDYLN